jgi:cell division protein FtsW
MLTWILNRLKGDKIIWITIFLIAAVSLLAIYSSTSAMAYRLKGGDTEAYAMRHLLLLCAGFAIIFVVHLVDYRVYARIVNLMLFITIPLLLWTISQGSEVNEAARWITIFGQSFQPSDLAKITLMIFLAKLLTQRQDVIKDFTEGFLPPLFWIVVICGLIAPADLSTATMMFIASVMVMFVAGIDLKYIGMLVLIAGLGGSILFNTASRATTWNNRIAEYKERIFNPEFDGSPQTVQAHIAVAKGGLWGAGPGKSTQRNYLPAAYSDYVYAIIIEEYGLLGGGFVMFLYFLLLFRSVSIVTVSKTFGALMASGLAFMLVLQALVNMGVAVGLLPITGLTLPLISYGGTSILLTSVSIGIILSVSRSALEEKKRKKTKRRGRQNLELA